ncbi:MAG: SusD/RagB family nutrient-binding outer membrane lipoprotein [Gemmatimonadota bacterium]
MKGHYAMTRHRRAATRSTLALTLALAAAAGGCNTFLDINDDPNNPQNVAMELTLPGMLMAFGHEVIAPTESRYGNLTGPTAWGSQWMQQWSHNRDTHTYAEHRLYEVANADASRFWDRSYADVMREAVNIMARSEESGQTQFRGIAKFMLAWTATQVSDAYGPITFTEAFNTANRTPVYDTQQSVYAAAFTLIDEAIADMQSTHAFPVGYTDILYKGDMGKWVRLANSVKARLHLHLAYAPGESAAERAQSALTALAAGMAGPADAPVIAYEGGEDSEQPFYYFGDGAGENQGSDNARSSEFMVELLRGTADPRLPVLFASATLVCPDGPGYQREQCTVATAPVFRGHPSASPGQPDSAISAIGPFFAADSADHVWFRYEETRFIEAEARLILSGAAAADAPYRDGIRASMERLRVPAADITAYLAALPPLSSEASALEAIITQKYIANFLTVEVWNDWRRTGYPLMTPVPGAMIDGIPQRIRTPESEMSYNVEQVAATGIHTGLVGMLTEVWWASGTPPQ